MNDGRARTRPTAHLVNRPRPTNKFAAAARSAAIDDMRQAELLAIYSPLVRKIAGGILRKLPQSVLRDDLIGAGMLGLWDAIRRHGNEDERFEWYVRVRIRGAILDELRAADWLPRRARLAAEAAGKAPPTLVRLDDLSENDQERAFGHHDGIESEVEARCQGKKVARAVAELPEREREIVVKRYFEGACLSELGAALGVTGPRISQLHSRAMRRLRTTVRAA